MTSFVIIVYLKSIYSLIVDFKNVKGGIKVEHPQKDMFGTSIDYNETYYITHDEKVVHCLNLDEYMLSINAQEFKKED